MLLSLCIVWFHPLLADNRYRDALSFNLVAREARTLNRKPEMNGARLIVLRSIWCSLVLVFILTNLVLAQTEDQSRYLLPEDFSPFDPEEFHDAIKDDLKWEMFALKKPIRLGDQSQRAIWGGTQRDFNVDFKPTVLIGKVNREQPADIEVEQLAFTFSDEGIGLAGGYLKNSRWENGRIFSNTSKHATFKDMPLADGSGFTFYAPRFRWPQRQAALLACVRPRYDKLVYSKKGMPPKKIFGSFNAVFHALTFDFSYELEAEYISGVLPAKGTINIFTDPRYYNKPIEFDEVYIRNPIVEIYGSLKGKTKAVKLDPPHRLRGEVVSKATFSIGKGRRGVFLKHNVFEIHPAPDMHEKIVERLLKQRVYEAPFEGFSQCAYIVQYAVEREIYEKVEGRAEPNSEINNVEEPKGKESVDDFMS